MVDVDGVDDDDRYRCIFKAMHFVTERREKNMKICYKLGDWTSPSAWPSLMFGVLVFTRDLETKSDVIKNIELNKDSVYQ